MTEYSPTFWPGEAPGGRPGFTDLEKYGPIGAGTPHARMQWFWERMRSQEAVIAKLTGYSPFSSRGTFESAIADAFDKLVEMSGIEAEPIPEPLPGYDEKLQEAREAGEVDCGYCDFRFFRTTDYCPACQSWTWLDGGHRIYWPFHTKNDPRHGDPEWASKFEVVPDEDWLVQNELTKALAAAPPIVKRSLIAQIDNWDELIWELSKLAKNGETYEGETSEELLALLRQRLRKDEDRS